MTPRSVRPFLAAALIIVAGFLLRLPGLGDPPLDFHPARQYRSAIIARGYSLDLLADLPLAARQDAEAAAAGLPSIEPPVMERLASWVYHLIGREDLAWARALAVIAWSLGGLAMFWLAIQLLTEPAALTSVAVWTFLPFAIRASQSFQPDPLMTALVVFTLAGAVSYRRRPTILSGALFGCGLAAALAVKATAVFFLAPPLVALLVLGEGSVRAKIVTVGIGVAAIVPAAWFYATRPLGTGPVPQLLLQPQFWRDWLTILDRVVSWPLLVVALAGTLLANGESRRLLVALFAGYLAFGVAFTHHIHTHDYYSLPLVAVVALGVGALVERVGRLLPSSWLGGPGRAVAVIAGVGCLLAGTQAVAASQRSDRKAALRAEAARYARIGELVGHSRRVLALDGAYALPLIYHGHMLAATWPLSGDFAFLKLTGAMAPTEVRLRSSGADFFVCTIQPELDAQPDLAETLAREYKLLQRDGAPEHWSFVLYDLRRGALSATPAHLSMFSPIGSPASREETVSLYAPASSRWTVQLAAGSSLNVEPARGTGPATLRITAPAPPSAVDRAETVTVTSTGEGSTTFEVRVRAVAGPDKPPFGFVDAPADPVVLGTEPILFQGWALDDIAMKRVWVEYLDASGRIVTLGDAHREGRRPDLVAAFPTANDLFKAGWTFTLDPARVRNVARPIRLVFLAEDATGQRAQIGSRTLR
jgi:hypothetical protein